MSSYKEITVKPGDIIITVADTIAPRIKIHQKIIGSLLQENMLHHSVESNNHFQQSHLDQMHQAGLHFNQVIFQPIDSDEVHLEMDPIHRFDYQSFVVVSTGSVRHWRHHGRWACIGNIHDNLKFVLEHGNQKNIEESMTSQEYFCYKLSGILPERFTN